MIQKTYFLFKSFFKNNEESYSVEKLQSFEVFLLNHSEELNHHVHDQTICHYPKIEKRASYERNYIYRQNNHNVYSKINIPVVYCENDKHYHAILPYTFIIPYLQYSLSFVVSVLYDRLNNHLTISEIEEKYDISKNTLYRWIDSYKTYYRIFITMRNKKDMDFFVSYFCDPIEFIDSIYSIASKTLFQTNDDLIQPT